MMRRLLLLLLALCPLRAAETYVVAVGVSQYDDPGIAALHYAAEDATALARQFTAAGVPAEHVFLLTSEATDRKRLPTKFNLLHSLQAVREQAGPGDTVVLFFAGHGVEQSHEAYLLTGDSVLEQLEGTALPVGMIQSTLRGFQGAHVLCLIDACRNDPHAARGTDDAVLGEEFARGLRPRLTAPPTRPVATALLLACDVGQRAWEIPDEGHGAFTTYLLKGLAGAAKGPDGKIWLSGLARYVLREVPSWAERAHKEQTPRFDNPDGADFALLTPAAAPADAGPAVGVPIVDAGRPDAPGRAVKLPVGTLARGEVEAGATHHFQVTLAPGEYRLLLDAGTDGKRQAFNLEATLSEPSGHRDGVAYVSESTVLRRYLGPVHVTNGGPHRLTLVNRGGPSAARYAIAVMPLNAPFAPYLGDPKRMPRPLAVGSEVEGRLGQVDEETYYLIPDLKPGAYRVTLTVQEQGEPTVDFRAELYELRQDGGASPRLLSSIFQSGTSASTAGELHVPTAGRKVLYVRCAGGKPFSYTLKLEAADRE